MSDSRPGAAPADRVRTMFDEVLNGHRPDALASYFEEDVVDHSPGPGQGPGLAGIAQMVGLLLGLNPALRVSVDDVLVEGNRVAVRGTWHTVNGIQHIAHFFTFADGRIVEEWSMGGGDAPTEPPPAPPTAPPTGGGG